MQKDNLFLRTLFNPDESVCLTQNVLGTNVIGVGDAIRVAKHYQYFSINPLKERRKDANVTAYRNFLIEFDTMELDEQMTQIKESGLPYTSFVFSGKKSYHTIISLSEPLSSRHDYIKTAKWLYSVFPQADKSCQNPSRLSRMAGAMRKGTGKVQELIELKERVSRDTLMSWLKETGVAEPAEALIPPATRFRPVKNPMGLTMRTMAFLKDGAEVGSRTHSLFAASCNLHRCGYLEQEIVEMAKKVLDFEKFPHFYRTVKCAIQDCISKESIN